MSVDSNIIFRIGTAKIGGGFTELKSAIDLMGQMWGKVQETTKELDKFSQMWQRTNQQAVMAADAAAGGLIETGKVLQGYQKLAKAGVKVTDQQFATLTARAADLAQATGTDATEAFNRLTDSIVSGSTEALRGYGVAIKEGGGLTEMQKKAVEGLTAGFEGLNVKAKTTSERLFVLENNIGTFKGLLWEAVGASDAFGGSIDTLNGALGELNEQLANSPRAMENWITSGDGVMQAAREMSREYVKLFTSINPVIKAWLWLDKKAASLVGADKGLLEQFKDWAMGTGEAEQAALDALYNAMKTEAKDNVPTLLDSLMTDGAPKSPMEMEMDAAGFPEKSAKKKRRGGGGGRKKDEEMVFTNADVAQFEEKELLDITGGEPSTDAISALSNDELAERIDLNRSYTETIAEQEEVKRAADEAAKERLLEEAELKRQIQEEEIERVGRLKEQWSEALANVDTGSKGANKALKVLDKAVIGSINLSNKAGKASAGAVVETVAEVGGAISQEATWQGFIEIAKAIAATAEQNYFGAAAHTAASVAFFAAAAKTGKGGGGGGGAKESAAVRQSERFSADTGASNFGGDKNGGSGSMSISIQMKEGAGGFFDAMVEENDRASMDGRRNFAGS